MSLNLEYNTGRGPLLISEYGRTVQKMIAVAVAEDNREKRQKMANEIIALMGQLNPHLRDVADYKHKLWDHLFLMSNFQLDVDSPYPIPSRESLTFKPEPLAYPQTHIRFRFYGKNITKMIETVANLEDGAFKTAYINAVGSYMKMSSRNWNEEMLNDQEVMAHLSQLSKGKINLTSESEDVMFSEMSGGNNARRFNRNNKKHRNNRNGKNNNYKGFKRR